LDLPIFVLKALTLLNSKSTLSDALNFIPISIQFSGPLQLQLTSIRQKNFAHKEMFGGFFYFFFNLLIFQIFEGS